MFWENNAYFWKKKLVILEDKPQACSHFKLLPDNKVSDGVYTSFTFIKVKIDCKWIRIYLNKDLKLISWNRVFRK